MHGRAALDTGGVQKVAKYIWVIKVEVSSYWSCMGSGRWTPGITTVEWSQWLQCQGWEEWDMCTVRGTDHIMEDYWNLLMRRWAYIASGHWRVKWAMLFTLWFQLKRIHAWSKATPVYKILSSSMHSPTPLLHVLYQWGCKFLYTIITYNAICHDDILHCHIAIYINPWKCYSCIHYVSCACVANLYMYSHVILL